MIHIDLYIIGIDDAQVCQCEAHTGEVGCTDTPGDSDKGMSDHYGGGVHRPRGSDRVCLTTVGRWGAHTRGF